MHARFSMGMRRIGIIAATATLMAGSSIASGQTIDGSLDEEVLLILTDANGNGIADIVESGFARGVAFAKVDDRPDGTCDPREDGFRDAGLGYLDIPLPPGCTPDELCYDLVSCSNVRSGMNFGRMFVIYVPDPELDVQAGSGEAVIEPAAGGDGVASTIAMGDDLQIVTPGNPVGPGHVIVRPGPDGILDSIPAGDDSAVPLYIATDQSFLYVGLDIFTADRRMVVGDLGEQPIDFLDINNGSVPGSNGLICDEGVADYDGDGVPEFYGVPFDIDADGNPCSIGRWGHPWLPLECQVFPLEGDLGNEAYSVSLLCCVDSSGSGDLFAKFSLKVEDGNTLVQLLFFDGLSSQPLPPGLVETVQTFPPYSRPGQPVHVCDLAGLGPLDVEYLIPHVDTYVDLGWETPYEIDILRFFAGGVQANSDSDEDSAAEDRATMTVLPPLGDMNCDWKVDLGDINPFVLALTDCDAYMEAFPNCNWWSADINGDGEVDVHDINPFVVLLIESYQQ